jgi:hypothetical protein
MGDVAGRPLKRSHGEGFHERRERWRPTQKRTTIQTSVSELTLSLRTMKSKRTGFLAALRVLSLLSLALAALHSHAVIVSTNTDAVEGAPTIRFCTPGEVAVPNTASLCALGGVNGASQALPTAQSMVTRFGWNNTSNRTGDGPLTATEATRLRELADLSATFSVAFNTRGNQFVGTWGRSFSGPLLLQVAEVPFNNVITSKTYYYWFPQVEAQAGDVLRFEPNFFNADPIAWLNLYTLAPIPEPGSAALLALGLGLMAWRVRREHARR